MEVSALNSMCRCCATEGVYKDIKTSYHWMGEEEIYGDMLQECFDVNLTSSEEGGICEVCITQLRNASNFKKQVLQTEEQFKKHLQSKGFKSTQVKEEISGFDENDSDDMDNVDDEDYVPDYEVPIKIESESEEKPPKKRPSKAPATRAKKSKSSDADANIKTESTVVAKPRARKKRVIIIRPPPPTAAGSIHVAFKKSAELGKHQTNIRTILLCSNATPIRRYGGVGFMCCFCPQEFPEAPLLKKHTLQSHGDAEKEKFMRTFTLPRFLVKLDITDLICSLCRAPFDHLEDFTTHLVTAHNKNYYNDIKSHIIPFKFSDDLPKCVLCPNQYNNFKMLQQHMNLHFRNHVCEICGHGFVNLKVFHTHMYRHNKGVFNCSKCDKVFDTRVKWKDHERATHKWMQRRNKCAYCGERFQDYVKKNSHEVKFHGVKPLVLHCLACEKTFDNQRSLNVHKKMHFNLTDKKVKVKSKD